MSELGFFGNFIFAVLHWDTVDIFVVITFWLVFDFFFNFSILTLLSILSKSLINESGQGLVTCRLSPTLDMPRPTPFIDKKRRLDQGSTHQKRTTLQSDRTKTKQTKKTRTKRPTDQVVHGSLD